MSAAAAISSARNTRWSATKRRSTNRFLSDWSNFNQWTENGAVQTPERANAIWKQVLRDFEPPALDESVRDALDDFVARRTAEGGAPPLT